MSGPEPIQTLLERLALNRFQHLVMACTTRDQCIELANLLATGNCGALPADEVKAEVTSALYLLGRRTAGFP